MSLIATEQVTPQKTALEISAEIGFNDWKRLLEHVLRMGDSAQWWIGDCLSHGRRSFSRDYREWFDEFDRTHESLRVYEWVASRVAAVTRVTELTWTHHRAVASLDAEDQARWLDDAIRQGWSTRELDHAIHAALPRGSRPPALTLRAVGELHDLCTRAAARAGLDPAVWAAGALERAARAELKAAR